MLKIRYSLDLRINIYMDSLQPVVEVYLTADGFSLGR